MKKVIIALALLVGLTFASGLLVHANKKADGTTVTTYSTTSDPGGGRP